MFLLATGNSWAQPFPYKQVAPLIEKLTDNDFRIRHDAADAIAKIGSPAVPFLIEALQDENKQVRWRAASALGEIGAEASAAVPALIVTLQDEDEYIRWSATAKTKDSGASSWHKPMPCQGHPQRFRASC